MTKTLEEIRAEQEAAKGAFPTAKPEDRYLGSPPEQKQEPGPPAQQPEPTPPAEQTPPLSEATKAEQEAGRQAVAKAAASAKAEKKEDGSPQS